MQSLLCPQTTSPVLFILSPSQNAASDDSPSFSCVLADNSWRDGPHPSKSCGLACLPLLGSRLACWAEMLGGHGSHTQAADGGAEDGAGICADLLTARWGEQPHTTVTDRGACDAFLPCLGWAAEPPSEPLFLLEFTACTAILILSQGSRRKTAQDIRVC